MPSEYPNNNERMIFSMSVLKSKAKSVIAIFICLSLLFGEVMFFPLNSKAETLPIEQSAPLLDVEVDEEEFIIDEGEEGGIRHFPFVFGFGDDIFVSFSQHRDAHINHAVDGMRISRDGGATWSTYIEDQDFYLTSLIKLNNGDLFGISYPSYYIDERHASLKYVVSKDNGETWIHSEGTVEFPKDIGKSADSDWASMVPHRSIMQMPDGTLYGTMYGMYAVEGESNYRSIWIKSTDGGANWTVVSDIAVLKGVAGEPQSYCEPTFEVCSDGSILCVLRTASGGDAAHPLYQCRSTDGGLTWSTPEIIPGVTVDDAGCADPCLYMMSNGVLVLSYGRQHCKMLFSGDGTGETWTNFTTTFTETAEKISSCYTGVYEVSPGKLLLVGDKAGANSENQKIWGKYVYVTKHNVAYESGVDAGHVEIDGNTYTAVPYDGNAFLGWYNSKGTLISTNITETFTDTDGIVTPKFRNNSVFKSPGFEYVELGSTHTKDPSTAIFPSWYTSQDWGSVNILTSETYDDGFRSMRVFSPYRVDLYTDITGLRQNTTYTVSYRWMMPRDYTTENNDCYNGLVASSPEYTSIGDAYKNTIGKSYYARYPEGGVWTKDTFTFNTGDLTTVRLFMDYSSLASSAVAVYIDDFTIYKNPEPLSVSIESGTDAGYITNDGNLYTAVPYDGNKFLGWYNSSGVISTKATEFFADTDGEIIAKFKNNSIFESPSFELNSVGTTYQYHEHSSDKDGWYITATWGWAKTVNNIAHSGSKALQIHGRFQTIYKNIIRT
ncbi:MAG: exo-alpha-sialidase [Ruminococcaceae bacterium]|nr:exo-alpha-sialidase [Oscillospiraceae bacterium]